MVETVGFSYGQRHDAELDGARGGFCRRSPRDFPELAARRGDDHAVDMSALGAISETALTRDTEIMLSESGLPNTFVPGRNILFFTYAAAIGYRRGIMRLVGRHVRNRLFRLSRLPQRHADGAGAHACNWGPRRHSGSRRR